MSAPERIAEMLEWVRAGNGDCEAAARKFRMTIDVVRRQCAAANVISASAGTVRNQYPVRAAAGFKINSTRRIAIGFDEQLFQWISGLASQQRKTFSATARKLLRESMQNQRATP